MALAIPFVAAGFFLAPPPGGCAGALCDYAVLEPFIERLAEARSGDRKPVHILQIGDSHTAGDAITGAWREILQGRYGSGGRGVMPAGKPFNGYNPRGLTVEMSPGWKITSIFGPSAQAPRPPVGLAGFSLTSTIEGARIGMIASPDQAFDRFILCGIAQPDGGTIVVTIGAQIERLDFGSATARAECQTIRTDSPQLAVSLGVEGGPVTITSLASFRASGGVVLSNLGVVGSQLVHFARNDYDVLAEELRHYDPDLIVVAFGTNEGFAPRVNPAEYEITLRSQIGRLRRIAGRVPILMLGAPDALTRRPEMLSNASGFTPIPCPEPVPPAPPVSEPANIIAADPIGDVLASLDRSGSADSAPVSPTPAPAAAINWGITVRPLFPPAGLKVVRDVQRRIAHQMHVAFWDWEARMGGRCTAVSWAKLMPTRMRSDYVHYNSLGGREIGTRLQADMDEAQRLMGIR